MTTPKQQRIREWIGIVLVSLVCIATAAVFVRAGELIDVQKAGIVRGYKTRAAACRIIEETGRIEDADECTEPEMAPYFRAGP